MAKSLSTNAIQIRMEGDEQFKQMIKMLPKQFEANVMRAIARKGGRVIVKAARVKIPGQLGSQIKKDIGVVNDKKNRMGVKVKLRYNEYSGKNGKQRVVGPIAGHFTEGVKQSNRKGRGKVKQRYSDFIEDAGRSHGKRALAVMEQDSIKIMNRHIARWQRGLVKSVLKGKK